LSNQWILRPSEIDTFLGCQKKWGFRYLDNIDHPPSPAIKLGIAVHKVLENYLINNQIDDQTTEGQIAKTGLKFLPAKLSKNHVEKKFYLPIEDFLISGTPDFFQDLGNNIWLLGDHKTCSTFSSALKPDELKENTQANIYAYWLFKEKNAELVKLRWIYYRTKGSAQDQCVEAELKPDDNDKNCEKLFAAAREIIRLRMNFLSVRFRTVGLQAPRKTQLSTAELTKNLSACFKYGRCPYYATCKYGATERPANQSKLLLKKAARENGDNAHIPAPPSDKSRLNQEAFHLFIDCTPIKTKSAYQNIIELSELLKPVLEKIHTEKNLKHYRLAGYGQHVGIMAQYLEDYLHNKVLGSNTAVLSSSKTPEGIDTLQTLSAAASMIVRGF